jgi:[ribosomal protein S5]-alanine N-acetyltransferase
MQPSFKYDLPGSSVLETERLYLREMNPEILEYMFACFSDEELLELMGLNNFEALEVERGKFQEGMTTYWISFKNFLITDKLTGSTYGRVGYHTWYKKLDRAEIGYQIQVEEAKGKGYMSEAMEAVLTFGFDKMGLNRVEAFLSPQNLPSKKLVERFGFQHEGLLREHYLKNGVYEDSACYGLLRSEYKGQKR